MPSLSTYSLSLTSAREFEMLMRDFAEIKYQGQASLHGRPGQKQDGVDIVVKCSDGKRVCVQCKNWKRELEISDIDTMITETENFHVNISLFVIAVTTKTNKNIQKYVYNLSDKRIREQKFPIDIIFWEDIEHVVKMNQSLLRIYYPELYINLDKSKQKWQIYPNFILDKKELRTCFVCSVKKWHIMDMLSVDPFAGFRFQLVIDTDCFEIEMKNIMDKAILIAKKKSYLKIAEFLTKFSNYCYYISMIAEPANESMLIVRNPFERERIHEHKEEIEELRVMSLKMLSKAGKIPINYPGVNS